MVAQPEPLFPETGQGARPALRAAIAAACRLPETDCVPPLIGQARLLDPDRIQALAIRLARSLRERGQSGGVQGLMREFSLSSQEGVALMCLAEALLRIPDRATRDALIRDKIAHGDWKSHLGAGHSLFVSAAAWGLMITGRLVAAHSERGLSAALARLVSRGGEPIVRQGVNLAMRMMGEQFVSGRTIAEALSNNRAMQARGFRYSYDMLGEAAVTHDDAERYCAAYEQAIHAIGKAGAGRGIHEGPGLSIKLSALHPRYGRAQRDRVMRELLPRLQALAVLARGYDLGLNIDAEEADRLELSLDLLESLCFSPGLRDWNGVGFVVQAYQKRAPVVIDHLIDLARRSRRRLMIRLVKGAYWDSEIKRAQVDGLSGYPVYTRKVYTDVSYLACARKLLDAPDAAYPQFATHNAHTLAAVYHLAGPARYRPGQFEFQCLHGMGEPLYEEVIGPAEQGGLARPCRIYAPVGTHETLLAYLVRRLLENGANTSFVNLAGDETLPVETLVADPVRAAADVVPPGAPHAKIPLPRDIFGGEANGRPNSMGLDLADDATLEALVRALQDSAGTTWRAAPMLMLGPASIQDGAWDESRAIDVFNPADGRERVGQVIEADQDEVRAALRGAALAAPLWRAVAVAERARILNRAACLLEGRMMPLVALIVREAGRSLAGAVAEAREAVDFLRYYAAQAGRELSAPGHCPLGTVLCISPWNFPLSIFIGQVAAALAAGNAVIAKPAEQTPLIAARAMEILREAGVPAGAAQLLPGSGVTVGAALAASPEVHGVMFTGSTEVARGIAGVLAGRSNGAGHAVPFIAETGGQNAMIVDSSALAEQVAADVLTSAFDSAGQRCSALRVLCLQQDCADRVLAMLRGAMRELRVGNPAELSTDVGPVIDAQARDNVLRHIEAMRAAGRRVEQIDPGVSCGHGVYVAPALIEIDSIAELEREVFGPVLHVVRYARDGLDAMIDQINATGYGLTFGVHTRIDETIARATSRVRAGNLYVNRNIVGAVVGVQPFGGQGLSGTGPKAGGPLYLYRLLSARPPGLPPALEGLPDLAAGQPLERELPGPTGERNRYGLRPRGRVLGVAGSEAGARAQWKAARLTGNVLLLVDTPAVRRWREAQPPEVLARTALIPDAGIDTVAYGAALFEGDSAALCALSRRVAARRGPIVSVQGLAPRDVAEGVEYCPEWLLEEYAVCVNTAAAGGNASLMTIG